MSKKNTDKLTTEQLSQLMDGEWHDIDASRCVEIACGDQALRDTWSRWHVARDVARGEQVAPLEHCSELASRIHAAIADEPAYTNVTAIHADGACNRLEVESVSGVETSGFAARASAPRFAWRQTAAGLGIAASVAMATVLGLNLINTDAAVEPSLVANASAPGAPAAGAIVRAELPEVELVGNSSSFAVESDAEGRVQPRVVGGELFGLGLSSAAPVTLDCEVDGAVPALGDTVAVEAATEGSSWLLVVAAGYVLPTVGLVLGVVVGAAVTNPPAGPESDVAAAWGGVLGLAGGVLAWRLLAPRFRILHSRGPRAKLVRTEPCPAVFLSQS